MSMPSILLDLRTRVRSLSPDIVVLYPSPAFYVDRDPPHTATDVLPAGELDFARALQPRVWSRIEDAAKSLVPSVVLDRMRAREIRLDVERYPAGWRFTTVPPDRLALFGEHLREVVGTIRSIGAEPILMTHGNAFMGGKRDEALERAWERFYPRATGRVLIEFDAAAREATLQVARDSSVVVVDVAGDLARAGDGVYSDFAHFTERGAARVAGQLSDAVQAVVANTDRGRDVAGTTLQAADARMVGSSGVRQ
jgi:hypothetical protein